MGRARARPTLPTSALAEIFEVADADPEESAALAALLCYTGIPIDDICRLRWCELTWGRDVLDCEVRLGAGRDRRVYVVNGAWRGAATSRYPSSGAPGPSASLAKRSPMRM